MKDYTWVVLMCRGYICGHPLWNTLILEVTQASRVRALSKPDLIKSHSTTA